MLPGGVNFSVFSRQATRIELLLFDNAAAAKPARVVKLDPRTLLARFVSEIRPGQLYAYRRALGYSGGYTAVEQVCAL